LKRQLEIKDYKRENTTRETNKFTVQDMTMSFAYVDRGSIHVIEH
jgi:hypothetical protein